MKMAKIMEIAIYEPLEDIEKQLKSNLKDLRWEIENTEDLRTIEGHRVKIYFGVTSSFGGVNVVSFINHGGGYVPYYIKLTEIGEYETKIMVAITGAEDVITDYGNRNENIAKQLLEMCQKDCTNKTFKEKARKFFK
ncbi:hypothetical protein [Clostridium tetani]|uniref:hypothetical protein n=1 Tax=Clostridium tetani TaxID=1513 RepID=UPI000512A68D|nr:hypothetical protein [Clostridium tetani]KGI44421.1 hypothetical protein KY55_03455 [Clostridium tetani]BDR85617.1 hypothetical protein N071400001_02250 [Clostridium tetani]